jgi:hypothetical protein
VSDVEIETARAQWASANDRLEAARDDRRRYDRLHAQVAAVSDELRRRIGDVFTLAELVAEYGRAERWTRDAAAEVAGRPADLQDVALVEDAAFHLYARGAIDYVP